MRKGNNLTDSNKIKSKEEFFAIEVTKKMARKVTGAIQPGDVIVIDLQDKKKPNHGQYVLVSCNEEQWIEKFWDGLKKRYRNIYPVVKIII